MREDLELGWHLDANDPTQQRYWDGEKWTRTRPVPSRPAETRPEVVPPPSGAPAGWYRDPDQVGTQRYWTGSEWTDQRAPLAPKAAKKDNSDLAVGMFSGLLIPFLGVLWGIYMLFKGDVRGLGVIGWSIVVGGLFWIFVIALFGFADGVSSGPGGR